MRLLATSAALACLALGVGAASGAQGPSSSLVGEEADRATALVRARELAAEDPGQARHLCQVLLARDPANDEARALLGRLDLRGGDLRAAEAALREVLDRHPADAEVRAALVDALMRLGRLDEAALQTEVGLSRVSDSPDLLARRARLEHWRGEEDEALADARRAAAVAPEDEDLQALLESIRRGEAQALIREDVRADRDDVHLLALSVARAIGRTVLGLRTEQSQRFASSAVNRGYNALYAVSFSGPLGAGFKGAGEMGLGAPAAAVPRRLLRASLERDLDERLSAQLAYTLWSFDGLTAHLVQPLLSVDLAEAVRLDLRYALAEVVVQGGASRAVHSGGAGLVWRARRRLSIGASYLYGVQLERSPDPLALFALRSHVVNLAADLRLSPAVGLRPLYALELRRQPVAETVHSLQLGVYTRW